MTYRWITVLGVAAMSFATTVTAASADAASPVGEVLTTSSETGGILAEYEGRVIDLSRGWQGASVCVEQQEGGYRCFDDDDAYRAASDLDVPTTGIGVAGDKSECPEAYLCLWDNDEFDGRRVQFITAGTHDLADVGFRNQANSVYNRRSQWSSLHDYDCPWPAFAVLGDDDGERNWHSAMSQVPQYCSETGPPDGTWNNAVDWVILRT